MMISLAGNPAVERSARRVRLLRVRAADSTMRMRVQFLLEEALRLTTLPGEEQGRVYFFRRLRLPALKLWQSPREWVTRCSERLVAAADRACHAMSPAASTAEAVYFLGAGEPFRLMFASWLADRHPDEWFWAQATGVPAEVPRAVRVAQLFDLWRSQPAGWAAVAREFLPSLATEQIARAVALIPAEAAQRWLSALEADRPQPSRPIPTLVLRAAPWEKVHRARLLFGESDARVRWLCALAILESNPAQPQDATLVAAASRLLDGSPPPLASARDNRGRLLTAIVRETGDGKPLPAAGPHLSSDKFAQNAEVERAASSEELRAETARRTAFAGLYFLLVPLRLLGIVVAYEAHPQLAATHFVERVLLRLARHAGIQSDDPILLPCLERLVDGPHDDPLVLPRNLAFLSRLHTSTDLTERLWAAAVRRWCHQHARMRLAAVASRPGRMYLSPTALDITMPMSAVDLRIRRCGLDLDPGYLPWFGCVVHFHYHVEDDHGCRGDTQA